MWECAGVYNLKRNMMWDSYKCSIVWTERYQYKLWLMWEYKWIVLGGKSKYLKCENNTVLGDLFKPLS